MKDVDVKDLFADHEPLLGQKLSVSGWIRTVRNSKNVGFIELNDGTYFGNLQVVLPGELPGRDEIGALPISTGVTIEGELVASPKEGQPFELRAEVVRVEAPSSSEFPLQKKRHTFEYLRTIAHLRPRGNTFSAVFRLRSLLAFAIHEFFRERGFVYVHTPILTASDCEGSGELFRVSTLDMENLPRDEAGAVDYAQNLLGKDAYLTVSGQLEVETYCMAFKRVYTFGPTFRAENSNTSRHACEFWMIEPEIAFAGLPEDMQLAEDMLKSIVGYVREHASAELDFFNRFIDKGLLQRLDTLLDASFECVTYTDAVAILEKADRKFEFPVAWGKDLQSEHERYLTEEYFKSPVFVVDYPKEIKAFYMRMNDDERTVSAMDLLVPGVGEIIGGSAREERLDVLQQRIDETGMDMSDYWWYLDLRKYGGVRHAGFGMGFERALMYVTGMDNIRDVIPFPRTPQHVEF